MRDLFTEDTARRFWQEQRQRVQNAEGGETIDFSEMHFPDDPDSLYFDGIGFVAQANFSKASFYTAQAFQKTRFHDDVTFANASFGAGCIMTETVFESDVNFGSSVFGGHAYIVAEFQGDSDYSGAVFKREAIFGDDLGSSVFKGLALFMDAIFEAVAEFENVVFEKNVRFKGAKFRYWTQFIGTTFKGKADFEKAIFDLCHGPSDKRRNVVRFFDVTFNEKAIFWDSLFLCKTQFQKVRFNNGGEFRKAKFRNEAKLINCTVDSRLYFDRCYKNTFINCADAVEPYRMAKQTAINEGDLRWTGLYHYQEQCAINETERTNISWQQFRKRPLSTFGQIFWAWGEFFIGRLLFGYGEKPLRPLGVGAIVVFICGVIFWMTKGIDHNPPCSFLSSMYFSIVTFTTLGYGDLKPAPGMRWLAGTEAILGVALMALFIVALSRKFSR